MNGFPGAAILFPETDLKSLICLDNVCASFWLLKRPWKRNVREKGRKEKKFEKDEKFKRENKYEMKEKGSKMKNNFDKRKSSKKEKVLVWERISKRGKKLVKGNK